MTQSTVSGTSSSDPTDRPIDVVAVLLSTYLFRDLAPAELEPVVRATRTVRVGRGETVFGVGDTADAIYVVASGQLKEVAVGDDGEEIVFEVFTRGAVEGEPGIFSVERDRVVSMVAMDDSVVLKVARDAVVAMASRQPTVMMRLLEGLATQVRGDVESTMMLVSRRVADRVALKLLELAMTHGRPDVDATRIRVRLSQSDLAAMTGATRENVNRALAEFMRAGLVHIDGREFVIDPRRIAEVADATPMRHRRNRLAP